MIKLLSCLLVIRVAWRRRLSCNINRTHSWVSILQSLRSGFVLTDNSCSGWVKDFVGNIFTKSPIHLSRKAPGGSTNLLLGLFRPHNSGCVRFVKTSVNFRVSHHVHTSCLHVHIRQIEMAGAHADHRSWIAALWIGSVYAFVNSLLILAWASSC